MAIRKLSKITRFQGDDYPREVFRLIDGESGNPVDLSDSDLTVLIKMRKVSTTTVLMMTTGTKSTWANNGVFFLDWPATALDQDEDMYELEVATSQSNTTGNITAATQASPVVITSALHGLSTGDEIYISGVSGMTEINNLPFIITKVDDNSFSLDGVDGSNYTAYSSGGTWAKYSGVQTCLTIQPVKIEEDF